MRADTTRDVDEPLELRLAAAEATPEPEVAARFREANRHDDSLLRLFTQTHARLAEASSGWSGRA